MPAEYSEQLQEAMDTELEALVKRKAWNLVPRPTNTHVIPGTWAFRIKRRPDGSFNKFKARFCVRGDLQKKTLDDATDVFSPVVNWSTIRTMLVLTQLHNLKTVHLDFSNAFAQSTLPE